MTFNSQLQFPKTAISDGTAILGTLANPVRVDPTGTTTQPVNVVSESSTGVALQSTGQATLTGSSGLIVASNSSRASLVIANTSSTRAIYIGVSGVTNSTGHWVGSGTAISLPITSAVYGVSDNGSSVVVTFLEIE